MKVMNDQEISYFLFVKRTRALCGWVSWDRDGLLFVAPKFGSRKRHAISIT